jgi:predicted enzyme related to lactoylglutathione lyase
MLGLGSIVLGVDDVPRAVKFWMSALDFERRDPPDTDDDGWVVLRPKAGNATQIALMKSETPVQPHPRIHIDLYADEPSTEIERLKSLGATDVGWDRYPDDADFVVLADPDGNRFCVIDKSV